MKALAIIVGVLLIISAGVLFYLVTEQGNRIDNISTTPQPSDDLTMLKRRVTELQCELGKIKAVPPATEGDEKIVRVAKDVLSKNKDALVMVRLVIKMKVTMGGQDIGGMLGGLGGGGEQKVEANGTIVDPSGLTIISAAQTDPSSMLDGLNLGGGDEEGEGRSIKTQASVISVKIVLNDGKELPATIALKDKDLDLAFVRPEEKGLNLPYIKLDKTATPNVLDDVIMLSRLDFTTGREPTVSYAPISSIIKKPRAHYMVAGAPGAGNPVFNIEGQCLGIALTRSTGTRRSMSLNVSDLMGMMPMVLPSEDIIDVMKQVPPAEEKKE